MSSRVQQIRTREPETLGAYPIIEDEPTQVRAGVVTLHISERVTNCFVEFDPPFDDVPVVVMTVHSPTDFNLHPSITAISQDICTFTVWNEDDNDDLEDPAYLQWMACLPTDVHQDNC